MNIIQRLWIKLFVKRNFVSFDLDAVFLNGDFQDEVNWELIRLLRIFKKLNYKIALIEENMLATNNLARIQEAIITYNLPVDEVRFTNFENKGELLLKIGSILHFNRLNSEEDKVLECGILVINVYQDGFVI